MNEEDDRIYANVFAESTENSGDRLRTLLMTVASTCCVCSVIVR